MSKKYASMQQAIDAHIRAGGYFFNQGALDFWEHTILHNTFNPETGLFIMCEDFDSAGTRVTFSIRKISMIDPKHIEEIGTRHPNLQAAINALNAEIINQTTEEK